MSTSNLQTLVTTHNQIYQPEDVHREISRFSKPNTENHRTYKKMAANWRPLGNPEAALANHPLVKQTLQAVINGQIQPEEAMATLNDLYTLTIT